MVNCYSITNISVNGTINVDIPNNNITTQNFKTHSYQNNDECSILISSYSNEQNYSVKYKESNIKQIIEKNKQNNINQKKE